MHNLCFPQTPSRKFNLSFCPTFASFSCLYCIFSSKKLHCKEYTPWNTNNSFLNTYLLKSIIIGPMLSNYFWTIVLNAFLPQTFIILKNWTCASLMEDLKHLFCIIGERIEDTFTEPGNNTMAQSLAKWYNI